MTPQVSSVDRTWRIRPPAGRTRQQLRWRLSRGGLVVAAVAALVVTLALTVAYPLVGRWMIRTRTMAALEARFGRASIGSIDVGLGHAVLRNVRLGEPARGLQVVIERIDVEVATWSSLVGRIHIDRLRIRGVTVQLGRGGAAELLATRTARRGDGRRPRLPRPDQVVIEDVVVDAVVQGSADHARAAFARLTLHRDERAELRDLDLNGPARSGARLRVPALSRDRAGTVTWAAGELALGSRRFQTVDGTVRRAANGGLAIFSGVRLPDLGGGAAGEPWQLSGTIATSTRADLAITSPRRAGPPAVLRVALDRAAITFEGDLALPAATVTADALAEQPVAFAPIEVQIRGRYDRGRRALEVPRLTVVTGGVTVETAGTIAFAGGRDADGRRRSRPRIDARVMVPPVPCDRALRALPDALVPTLAGYELAGTFALELHASLDGARLAATEVEGSGGLSACQVMHAPARSPTMLTAPFELRRQIAPGAWRTVPVGPRQPRYARLGSVAQVVLASLTETEDPGFYFHDGFDAGGLRGALIADLEAGRFRLGASTITMQLARNVFLDGHKTLSRKLQEIVLAWHIERVLSKPKILELYLNVIEFGPGVYGIGAAAQHYFARAPLELGAREAAFFSAIVPRPTTSYEVFCTRRVDEPTRARMRRALTLLVNAGHITSDEWRAATLEHLAFSSTTEPLAACLARRDRALAVLGMPRGQRAP